MVEYEPTVDVEKYEGCIQPRTLVTVKKGLVLSDVERLGSGHLEDVAVQELAIKRCLDHGHGRFKGTAITNTSRTAKTLQLIIVQLENVLDSEENRIEWIGSHLANLRNVRSWLAIVLA